MRQGVMLCYPFDENRFVKWGSRGLAQPKLDGIRCRAVIADNGEVTLLSSQENVFTSVPHIRQQLQSLGLRNRELDGELYTHGMSFQSIASIVKTKIGLHPDFSSMEYHVFDVVDSRVQSSRVASLESLPKLSNIYVVQTALVENLDDLEKCYTEFIAQGYEGFVVRQVDAPYVRRRSTSIMKWKPYRFDEYEVVGYEEEYSIYNEPKDTLGALVLRSDGSLFSVGSGFTEQQRQELWLRRDSLTGRRCKVRYQELTVGREVPRFPVFYELLDAEVS